MISEIIGIMKMPRFLIVWGVLRFPIILERFGNAGNSEIHNTSIDPWIFNNTGICSSKWPVARAGSLVHAGAVSNKFRNPYILNNP